MERYVTVPSRLQLHFPNPPRRNDSTHPLDKKCKITDSETYYSAVGKDRVFKEDTRETQMVPLGKSKGVGAAMGYQVCGFRPGSSRL